MSIQSPVRMTAEGNDLAGYQSQTEAAAAVIPVRVSILKARFADLWPATMVGFAVSLTVAWTGLLMGLMWWGIAWLMGPTVL